MFYGTCQFWCFALLSLDTLKVNVPTLHAALRLLRVTFPQTCASEFMAGSYSHALIEALKMTHHKTVAKTSQAQLCLSDNIFEQSTVHIRANVQVWAVSIGGVPGGCAMRLFHNWFAFFTRSLLRIAGVLAKWLEPLAAGQDIIAQQSSVRV